MRRHKPEFIDIMYSTQRTPSVRVLTAIKNRSLSTLRRLLVQYPDVLLQQIIDLETRLSPLALAVQTGQFEVVELLLDSGAEDVGLSKDSEGNSVLHLAAKGGRVDILTLYGTYYGHIVDYQNQKGLTALHVAAKTGDEACVAALLDLGADIDMPDPQSDTPLHFASSFGHRKVIRLLIERGATYQSKNERGWTASDYAYSLSVMQYLQDSARAAYEQNKRERARKAAAKKALRAAEAERAASTPSTIRSRTVSAGSRREAVVAMTSGGLGLQQLPTTAQSPIMPSAELMAPSRSLQANTAGSSATTLPSSSSTASLSSAGPHTPGPVTPPIATRPKGLVLPLPVYSSPTTVQAGAFPPPSPTLDPAAGKVVSNLLNRDAEQINGYRARTSPTKEVPTRTSSSSFLRSPTLLGDVFRSTST